MIETPRGEAFDLSKTYLDVRSDGVIEQIGAEPDFWPELMEGRVSVSGYLASFSAMSESMTSWEVHPKGDELIVCLEGAFDLVLETEPKPTRTRLKAPTDAVRVPPGVWHRFEVIEPGRLFFLTWGEGTEHKPLITD